MLTSSMDLRVCTKCNEPKPLSEYFKGAGYKDGYRRRCKTCMNREGVQREKKLRSRTCEKCGLLKPAIDFPRSRDIYSWCRACSGGSLKRWKAKHPEDIANQRAMRVAALDRFDKTGYARAYRLFKKYGISVSQYEAMFTAQDGKCAICKLPPSMENSRHGVLQVDHCHVSGKIRGLLCALCNAALGGFKDSVALLYAAADYLKRCS